MLHGAGEVRFDTFGRPYSADLEYDIPIPPGVCGGDDDPGHVLGATHEYDQFGRIISTSIPIPPEKPRALSKVADAPLNRNQNRRRRLDLMTSGCAPAVALRSAATQVGADENGQFRVMAKINGQTVEMLVDTGATTVLLTYDDALRAGISVRPPNFTLVANTCNGSTRIAPVVLERVKIGEIEKHDVEAAVSGPDSAQNSLLGMTFLNRLKRVELRGGTLELE